MRVFKSTKITYWLGIFIIIAGIFGDAICVPLAHAGTEEAAEINDVGVTVGVPVTVLGEKETDILFKRGIQQGDVIKSINGIPVINMEDMVNVIELLKPETPFNAQIIRGDSSVQLMYGERLYMAQKETERFRLRPIFEKNGYQPKWCEIMRLRDDSVVVKLGLQKNDAIKSFDGFSITKAEDLINSVNRAMRKSSFDIKIVRNNEPLAVVYVVEQK